MKFQTEIIQVYQFHGPKIQKIGYKKFLMCYCFQLVDQHNIGSYAKNTDVSPWIGWNNQLFFFIVFQMIDRILFVKSIMRN